MTGETTSLADSARSVKTQTERTPGYRTIDFSPTTLTGHDAFRWTFAIGNSKRVDYFLTECGTGIAVLGSTTAGRFPRLQGFFRTIAQSVIISCGSSAASPSHAPSPSPAPQDNSGSGFCSTHTCIPNFPNGTGYIVQCADGEYSHSGGRPGACSDHGGEASGPIDPTTGTDMGNGSGSGTSSGSDGSGGGTTDYPGTGYPVTCADGTLSYSGGRPGACSHHGGVG